MKKLKIIFVKIVMYSLKASLPIAAINSLSIPSEAEDLIRNAQYEVVEDRIDTPLAFDIGLLRASINSKQVKNLTPEEVVSFLVQTREALQTKAAKEAISGLILDAFGSEEDPKIENPDFHPADFINNTFNYIIDSLDVPFLGPNGEPIMTDLMKDIEIIQKTIDNNSAATVTEDTIDHFFNTLKTQLLTPEGQDSIERALSNIKDNKLISFNSESTYSSNENINYVLNYVVFSLKNGNVDENGVILSLEEIDR